MIDPFTLATGLAGLLSLTIELSKIITDYIGAVNNAPKDAQELFTEISTLAQTLERLVKFLRSENEKGNSVDQTSVLCSARNACQDQLQSLFQKLVKITEGDKLSQSMQRFKWPYSEKETRQAVESLHRCTQTFHFSLTIEGW